MNRAMNKHRYETLLLCARERNLTNDERWNTFGEELQENARRRGLITASKS
jgi:hypothetical protein